MAAVIQVKRGSASSWTSANTVLAAGEIGFETDTKKMKVGDGSTAWTSLGYATTDGDITGVTAGTGLTGGGNSGAVTLNLATPVATTNGGTAQTTYATGDLLYASAADTLSKRTIGTTGQVLTVSGGVPTWAAPAAGGKVLQVVSATTTTPVTTTSGSAVDSGLSVSITPSSASSKILVMTSQAIYHERNSINAKTAVVQLARGGTRLTTFDDGVDMLGFEVPSTSVVLKIAWQVSLCFLDSPNTTSATTYKTQIYNTVASVNSITAQRSNSMGVIIAMEIGA